MIKLKIGMILTTRELVERWGTDKQKANYEKFKKIRIDTKKSILKEAETECLLESFKEGRELRYKVIEIYESKKEKNRIRRARKYPEIFKEYNTSGVYVIKDKNNLYYIGSSVNVYDRFLQHNSSYELSKSALLDKESMTITIVEETKGIQDEFTLRYWEQKVMNWYINKGFEVVNSKASFKEEKIKEETKTIKVKAEDYDKAIEILKKYGIAI